MGKGKNRIGRKMSKQKRNRILITVCAAVLIVSSVSGLFALNIGRAASPLAVYSDGGATITLFADGTFTASLYHGEHHTGTYQYQDGWVTFTYSGITVSAALSGTVMVLPIVWSDGHGHGSGFLPLQK